MKNNLEMFVAFALLATAGAAAPQQVSTPAPTPAQSEAQPPQPAAKPALKLRLDEADLRRVITFDAKDSGNKQDAAQSLPELGGNPSRSLEKSLAPTPTSVFPDASSGKPSPY